MSAELVPCKLAGRCSGCAWIDKTHSQQLESKQTLFLSTLKQVGVGAPKYMGIAETPDRAVRDRVDLTISGRKIGFFGMGSTDILDMATCPMMSKDLLDWFEQFRGDLPLVNRGSVRLRVGPKGERGIWLDLANADVKELLDEEAWLLRLMSRAAVEVGQRRKRLGIKDGKLKLLDPEAAVWFQTWAGERAMDLFLPIGGFSQPGMQVNRVLVNTVMKAIEKCAKGGTWWVELGAGSGNFSLALGARGISVEAVEADSLAENGLRKGIQTHGLEKMVRASLLDFNRNGEELSELLSGAGGLLVDPPRSGLGKFLDTLEKLKNSPQNIVYVSCFPESLSKDGIGLEKLGYQAVEATGVDMFPGSPHMEWVVRWERMAKFQEAD